MPYKSKERQSEYNKEWRRKNRECDLKKQKERNLNRRRKVLTHYGNGKIECQCCKETLFEFLSIDHIKGGGTQHKIKIGTRNIYPWIIKNNYPEGFRILCHNCNQAIGFYGECPHKRV